MTPPPPPKDRKSPHLDSPPRIAAPGPPPPTPRNPPSRSTPAPKSPSLTHPHRPSVNPPFNAPHPPPRGLRPTITWGGGVVGVQNRGVAPRRGLTFADSTSNIDSELL